MESPESAELLMVGPGKLMVGTGPSRPGSGYATAHELIVASYCYISKQDYILYEFTKLSPNFTLLSVIGTITLHL